MKKVIISLSIFCTMSAGAQDISLNGYLKSDFARMRNDYIGAHTNTQTTSVWFDISVINQIAALMTKEQTINPNVDGIRVYYARVGNQNTVILVSTYKNGLAPDGFTKHVDYFNHDLSNPLFSNSKIHGEPSNNGSLITGADLYSSCPIPCPSDAVCSPPPGQRHYVTRKYAETMVHLLEIDNPDTTITRSEWFPLCLFTGFDRTHYDGLRIYFGRNRYDHPFYANKEAFVMELTNPSGTNHQDAFDCTFGQCPPELLKDLVAKYFSIAQRKSKKIQDQMKIKAFLEFARINGLDNGELCPTHCDGSTTP